MNEIQNILNSISDTELKIAVLEILEDVETGIIRDGMVRKYDRLLQPITNRNNLSLVENYILKLAAKKYATI